MRRRVLLTLAVALCLIAAGQDERSKHNKYSHTGLCHSGSPSERSRALLFLLSVGSLASAIPEQNEEAALTGDFQGNQAFSSDPDTILCNMRARHIQHAESSCIMGLTA